MSEENKGLGPLYRHNIQETKPGDLGISKETGDHAALGLEAMRAFTDNFLERVLVKAKRGDESLSDLEQRALNNDVTVSEAEAFAVYTILNSSRIVELENKLIAIFFTAQNKEEALTAAEKAAQEWSEALLQTVFGKSAPQFLTASGVAFIELSDTPEMPRSSEASEAE